MNNLINHHLSFRPSYGWALIVLLACALISAVISLQAGIFSVFFAIFAWWTWQQPEIAWRFLIIIAPLLPLFKATQTTGNITLVKDIIILTLFARLFAWPLATKTLPYRRNIIFAPLVALTIWTVVAWLQADSFTLGLLRARDILLYVLLYFGTLYLPHTKKLMRQRLYSLGASAIIVFLLSWYQWFFAIDSAVLRFDPIRSIWIPRVSGTFGHPTVLGEYLIMIITLATAGVIVMKKWVYLIPIALLMPLIYLTYSRGVWIGLVGAWLAMGVAVVWPKISKQASKALIGKILGVSVAVMAALLAIILFTPPGAFLRSSLSSSYSSNAIRLDFAVRLIAPMTNVQALIGRGLGDVTQQFSPVGNTETTDLTDANSRDIQLSKDSTLVDNQYLKTFVEMGLVGILIYAWIYIRLFKYSQGLTVMNVWFIGFLSAFLIQALFVDIWDVFPTNVYFWIAAGLLSAQQIKSKATA